MISTFLLIVLIAAAAVAFFALAMFLPYWLKGHNRDAEIGTNRHMRERGITCAARQAHEEEPEKTADAADCLPGGDCAAGDCGNCAENK